MKPPCIGGKDSPHHTYSLRLARAHYPDLAELAPEPPNGYETYICGLCHRSEFLPKQRPPHPTRAQQERMRIEGEGFTVVDVYGEGAA